MTNRVEILKTWGIVCFVLVLTLVVFEVGLRQTAWRHLAHSEYHTFPPHYFQSDPVLGVDLRPSVPPGPFQFRGPGHLVFTNDLGCFDEQRPIDDNYILVLGDSFTWGYSSLEHMWTSVLEKHAGRQVIKCGVDGSGTEFQYHKAKQVIKNIGKPPSLILILYTSNDFNDDIFFPGYQMVGSERVNNFEWLDIKTGEIKRNTVQDAQQKMAMHREYQQRWTSQLKSLRYESVLIAFMGHAIRQIVKKTQAVSPRKMKWRYGLNFLRTSMEEEWIELAFGKHLQNIKRINDLAMQHDASFMFLDASGPKVGHGIMLNAWLKENNIPLISMSQMAQHIAQRSITHPFDGHWNLLGNAIAGQVVFEELKRQGLLQ